MSTKATLGFHFPGRDAAISTAKGIKRQFLIAFFLFLYNEKKRFFFSPIRFGRKIHFSLVGL